MDQSKIKFSPATLTNQISYKTEKPFLQDADFIRYRSYQTAKDLEMIMEVSSHQDADESLNAIIKQQKIEILHRKFLSEILAESSLINSASYNALMISLMQKHGIIAENSLTNIYEIPNAIFSERNKNNELNIFLNPTEINLHIINSKLARMLGGVKISAEFSELICQEFVQNLPDLHEAIITGKETTRSYTPATSTTLRNQKEIEKLSSSKEKSHSIT